MSTAVDTKSAAATTATPTAAATTAAATAASPAATANASGATEIFEYETEWMRLETIPGCGRGFVARKDIPRGTILLREKAIASKPFQHGKASAEEMALDELTGAVVNRPDFVSGDRLLTDLCAYDYDATRDGAAETVSIPTPGLNGPTAGSVTIPKRRSQKKTITDLQWSTASVQVRTNCFFLPLTPSERHPNPVIAAKQNMRAVLFPLISRANHSCAPNAVMCTPRVSTEPILIATTDIARGTEIAHSYFEEPVFALPTNKRQSYLRYAHRFTCACVRCTTRNGPIDLLLERGVSHGPVPPAVAAAMEAEYDACVAMCGANAASASDGGARRMGSAAIPKPLNATQTEKAIIALSEWCFKWCGSEAFAAEEEATAAAKAAADSKSKAVITAADAVVIPTGQLHIAHWRCFKIRGLLYATFTGQFSSSNGADASDAKDADAMSHLIAEQLTAIRLLYPKFELFPRAFWLDVQRLFGATADRVFAHVSAATRKHFEEVTQFFQTIENDFIAASNASATATAAASTAPTVAPNLAVSKK